MQKTVSRVVSPKTEFLAGMRAQLPLMIGVIPFGLIYGALAVQLRVPPAIAQAMSSIIFAGSSQFIAVPLIAGAAPGFIIVLTVLVVNLRHVLYSASVAPYLAHLSRPWKLLLAYLLTDEAFAVAIARFQTAGYELEGEVRQRHWFLLGTGLTLWTCWQLSTAVGLYVGAQVPANWSLDFALPLTFIALVTPMLRHRVYLFAAFVAGVVSVLCNGLPYQLGLMLGALSGIVVGVIGERAIGNGENGNGV